jgi:hypothetical protein
MAKFLPVQRRLSDAHAVETCTQESSILITSQIHFASMVPKWNFHDYSIQPSVNNSV